jgi:PAS domain S-box-containing protein
VSSVSTSGVSRGGSSARPEGERLAELAASLLATTDADGRLLYVNAAWERLLGWDPHELIGRKAIHLAHPDDREALVHALRATGNGDELCMECRVAARDGSWCWIDWRSRVEGGRWYCAGQDVTERRRLEDARTAGEARLVEAQRVSGVGSFEFDMETRRLVWSEEHFRVVGLEPGAIEVTTESLLEFAHPDDRERLRAHWEQLLLDPSRAAGPLEFRMQRADGAERIVHLRGSVLESGNGQKAIGTIQDVSERRRAQIALEASERRYRALVEQVPAIVYTAALGTDGAWDFVSPHVERLLGHPAREWMENAALWYASIHPDDRERVMADEAELRGPGDQLRSEYRMVSKDGRVVHVRDEATVIENERGKLRLQGVVLDVTDHRQAEGALRESEERYRRIVETSQDLIFTVDAQLRVSFVNEACRLIFGYEPEEMVGRPFTDFQTPEMSARDLKLGSAVLAGKPAFEIETQGLRKDGTVVELSVNAVAMLDADGNAVGTTGTVRDITEAKRHEAALRETHARLQQIVDNSPLLVFAKGRDHRFLLANRELGELLGAEPAELVGTDAGDFLPPDLFEELIAQDARVMETGAPIEVEVTIPRNGDERAYLTHKFPLRDGDGAIYGMGAVATDITERKAREDALRARVEWSARIRHAIDADRFVLHAQPIVDVQSGEEVQQELLVRMVGEEGELIMPGEFLPAAERFDLAPAIDRWVVKRAARLARHSRVEVNLSGQSIGDGRLTELIEAELILSGADPGNLVFEITETTAAKDLGRARELADRLTALGCGFALDDFGTGYGSFTYLKHLPVSYLKIDMEFVRNLADDPADRQVVSAIVDVARNFDIKTIAEGVESQATLDLLSGLGVDYAQGYHLGRPVLVSD